MRKLTRRALPLLLVFCLLPLRAAAAPRIVYRHAGTGGGKRVALTFDDGPHPVYTRQILDLLTEYGVEATFFVVGENASYHPELVRRELEEGHEVGNHTYTHAHTASITDEAFTADVRRCSEMLKTVTGARPTLFRPPEGVIGEVAKHYCETEGMTVVLWSVDTRDWAHTPVETIVLNVRENVRDGSIILMHDFIGKNSPTPAALRQIIPMLQESGYEFVTVSQLLQN